MKIDEKNFQSNVVTAMLTSFLELFCLNLAEKANNIG